MRSRESLRCALLCLAGWAVAACDNTGTGPNNPTSPTSLQLQSDAGDYIGVGRTYTYTQANAVITVTANAAHLSIGIRGDEWWFGDFQGPSAASRLEPGPYVDLQRYPFDDPAKGGLSWSGEGRGCNTLSGGFTVDSVTYVGDALTAIDLSFEQHCEGATAALHGTIHWRADDTTTPPGPVKTIPADLWRPAPGATPATGRYIYLSSDVGDYIGFGNTYTYTPANATISVGANAGYLGVSINGAQWWSGSFQAMNSLTQLQTGYYGDLRRYPFHNPAKGGLDWWGEGRGCNTLVGWFAVDHVTYVHDSLTAIDMRFEQHCEGDLAALHGQIHWTATGN